MDNGYESFGFLKLKNEVYWHSLISVEKTIIKIREAVSSNIKMLKRV